MSANVGDLKVNLGMNSSEFSAGVRSAQSQLSSLQAAARSAGSSTASALGPLTSVISSVGSAASGATGGVLNFAGGLVRIAGSVGFAVYGVEKLSSAVEGAGQALLGYDAGLEQTRIALGTLLGSGDAATQMLSQLQAFAADTPFNLPGVENASRQLLAFGFTAKDIIPDLTDIGDAVSALGGGVFEINRVTLALGQMHAAGVVHAQDMMQLTQVGISAWQILADKMGVTTAELQNMVSSGIVPADQAIQDLLSGMEERYKGAMDAQSKTMTGIISNIQDSANMALGQIMLPLFGVVEGDLKDIQDYLASPDFAAWADRAQQSVQRWSTELQGIVVNDGPKVLNFLQGAASAAQTIAGDLKTVYDWADKIGVVFGQPGWQVLLEIYAAAKVAPLAMTVGKGLSGAGGVAGSLGGATSTMPAIPLMNVAADLVNVTGANLGSGTIGQSAPSLLEKQTAAEAAGVGAAGAGAAGASEAVTLAGALPLIGILVPLTVGVIAGVQQYGAGQKQIPGRGTAPSGNDYLAQGAQAVIGAPGIQAFAGQAAASPLGGSNLNLSQANDKLAKSYGDLDAVIQAVKDGTLDLTVAQTQAQQAESDGARQYAKDQEQVIQSFADLAPWVQEDIQRMYAQVEATQAVAASQVQLANAYQTGNEVQKVYSSQASEYTSASGAIKDAVDAINQTKKQGIPLSEREQELLKEAPSLQARYKGGVQDATIEEGLAAGAKGDLMLAQDTLNKLIKDGITSGPQYEDAVKGVQTAQKNAALLGGDPMAGAMQNVADTVTKQLVPAIADLVTALGGIPSVQIQIAVADQAAKDEIARLQGIAAQGIYMPFTIGTPGQSGKYASGGTVPHNMIASINEYGPELVVLPYAGRFAAGGTVGIANGGLPGTAVLPAGATVIPAGQTSQILSSLQQGLTPTAAIIAAATSDGKQIAEAMMNGVVAGVSSDTMVPKLTASLLPGLLATQDDVAKQLDLAKLSGASPDQIAKLQAQLDAITSLIQRWAEFNGTTVADAINASVSAITSGDIAKQAQDQLTKIQQAAFQNFDQITSGQAIPQLQAQIASLMKQQAIALATGASQEVIDSINQQLQQANQQLAEDQQVYAAAAKAGLTPQIAAISDVTITQIQKMEKDGSIAASALVDSVTQAVAAGTMTLAQAAKILPQSVIPDLQQTEQQIAGEYANALLTGADDAGQFAAQLHALDALINQIGQSADLTAPKIGDLVPGKGVYVGQGVYINGPEGDYTGGASLGVGQSTGAMAGTGAGASRMNVYGSMTLNFQRPATVDDILQKLGI